MADTFAKAILWHRDTIAFAPRKDSNDNAKGQLSQYKRIAFATPFSPRKYNILICKQLCFGLYPTYLRPSADCFQICEKRQGIVQNISSHRLRTETSSIWFFKRNMILVSWHSLWSFTKVFFIIRQMLEKIGIIFYLWVCKTETAWKSYAIRPWHDDNIIARTARISAFEFAITTIKQIWELLN